jgi:hypothetical protein
MSTARQIITVVGLGLCTALQSQCLHAQFEGGRSSAGNEPAKAEKSLLPEAAKESASEQKSTPICQCVSEADSASVQQIERALHGPLHSNGLDFVDTPLKDLAQQLQDDYGIPIQLDKAAMDEAGINEDQPVDISLHKISLQSALKIMLKKINLTYLIRDEVLLITTPDAASRDLKVCVYNVGDLVGDRGSDLESVADVIRSCIATDTWAKNGGGQAEIRAIKPDMLVISQTSDIQNQVRDLLSTVHKIHEQGDATSNAAVKSAATKHDEVVTRSYVLQMNPTNETSSMRPQIRELIVNALPDETWAGRLADGQPVLLEVFHDRIVVRQTPAVQQKVEKILIDSGIATPAAPSQPNSLGAASGFGMMGGPGGVGGFLNAQPDAGPEGRPGAAPGGIAPGFDAPGVQPGFGPGATPTPGRGD